MKVKRNYWENLIFLLFFRMKCCGVNSFEDWKDSAWWGLPERRNNKVIFGFFKQKIVHF
jgi:hypothetical protein